MRIRITTFFAAMLLSVIAVNAQFNYLWNQVRLGGSGAIPNFYAHPKVANLYYATTDVGTSYRWNNSAKSWEPIMMFGSIPSSYWTWEYSIRCAELAVDPSDATGNTLYASIASSLKPDGSVRHNIGTVMKSTDRGNSWTDLGLAFYLDPNGTSKPFNNRLTVDPANSNNIWLATDRNGTMKSMDAGQTWSKVNTGFKDTVKVGSDFVSPIRFLVCDPSGGTITNAAGEPASKVMYMGTIEGVFRSENGGQSFTKLAGSAEGSRRATMHPDGTLFVTYRYTSGANIVGGVQKYSNGSWVDIAPEPNKQYAQVAVNPANSNEVIIGTTGTWNKDAVYRSTNGGIAGSWTKLTTTKDNAECPHLKMDGVGLGNIANDAFGFYFDPFNAGKVWVADVAGVVSTDNVWASSTHWSMRVRGIEEVIATGKLISPNGGDNELLTTVADVGGANYSDVSQYPAPLTGLEVGILNGFNGQSVAYQENDPNFVVRICTDSWDQIGRPYDRSGYSTDGGKTYTRFNENTIPGLRGRVHITNNGRIIWMTQTTFPTASNTNVLGGIFYSDDKGATWTESQGVPRGTLPYGGIWSINAGEDKMAVDKVDPNLVYVLDRYDPSAGNSCAFYVSTDGGATFQRQTTANNLPGIWTWPNGSCYTSTYNLQTLPGRRGEVWLASDSEYNNSGIYYSTDAGKTFTHLDWTKAPVPRYLAVTMSDNTPDAHVVLFSATGNNAARGGVYKDKTLYRSDDRGVTWEEAGNPLPGLINTLAAGSNGKLYAAISGNGIWFAEQGGPVEEVSIALPDGADSVVVGKTLKLAVKFKPHTPTNRNVTWSSDDNDVATIDQNGLVTGVSEGTTTIRVVSEDGGKTASQVIRVRPIVKVSSIKVNDVIYVTPRTTKSITATVLPANATDKELSWESLDETVVTVDQNGNIRGLAKNTAAIKITATDGSGVSKTIQVIVNNTVQAINAGSSPASGTSPNKYEHVTIGQFEPEGPDGNQAPGANLWHCFSFSKVFPDDQPIDISATENPAPIDVYRTRRRQDNNVCRLNYNFRNLIPGGEYTVRLHFMEGEVNAVGQRGFHVYTNNKADSLKNMDIFKEAGGQWKPITRVLKAIANEQGRVTVTLHNGAVASQSSCISGLELLMRETDNIEFEHAPATVNVGLTEQFAVKFIPANATNKNIQWSSSNPDILTVDNTGKITGMAEGTATISVTASDGGFTLTQEVTVSKIAVDGLTVAPTETTLAVGKTVVLTPTISPANATYRNVEWVSSNDSLASVSETGEVTAKARGTVTITGKSADNPAITATATVHVVNVPIQDLTLTAPIDKLGVGATLQLNGALVPVNASPKQLIWNSSNTAVATVDNKGLVTAVGVGTTEISATTQDEVVISKKLNIEVVAMGECGVIKNNGFESNFLHWNKAETPDNVSITTVQVKTGYRAALIGSNMAKTTLTSEPITVTGGSSVNIQTMLKLARVDNLVPTWAGTLVVFYDADNNVITERRFSATTLSGLYAQYVLQNLTISVPASAVKMTVSYTKTGNGLMYIDDACVTQKTVGLDTVHTNPFGLTVSPNPVKNRADVSVNLTEGGTMRFRIYSLTGAVVAEQTVSMPLGANTLSFDTSRILSGTYTVEAYNTDKHTRAIVRIVK